METSVGLPQGFVLDQQPRQQPAQQGGLPQGFVLDQPEEKKKITTKEAATGVMKLQSDAGKAIFGGILNTAQRLGTGVTQIANELGSNTFAKVSKTVAKTLAPELSEEIDSFTTQEVTDLITKSTEEQVAARRGEAKEKGFGALTTTGEIGASIGLLGGVGSGIPGITAAAGLESALQPVKEGEGLTERGKAGAIGAGTGLAFGGAGKLARGILSKTKQSATAIKSGLGAKTAEELGETTAKLKEKASDIYNNMRNIDASISKRAGTKIVTSLDDTLTKTGKLNSNLHGDTLSVVKDIRKGAQAGQIGLEELDQYRQLLNQSVLKIRS